MVVEVVVEAVVATATAVAVLVAVVATATVAAVVEVVVLTAPPYYCFERAPASHQVAASLVRLRGPCVIACRFCGDSLIERAAGSS